MKPLGERQQECLRALREHGPWPGGWTYGNTSTTVRILDTLVARGLVTRKDYPNTNGMIPFIYRIKEGNEE